MYRFAVVSVDFEQMLYFFTNTFMTNFEQEFTAKAEYLPL